MEAVVIDFEFKPVQEDTTDTVQAENSSFIPEPINANLQMASESGAIRISFSRPILIILGAEEEAGILRRLENALPYSEEEKAQLASLISIEYDSQADEDDKERPELV